MVLALSAFSQTATAKDVGRSDACVDAERDERVGEIVGFVSDDVKRFGRLPELERFGQPT